MLVLNAKVIDVVAGKKLVHRAVSVDADGRIGEVAAAPPVGRPHSEVVDLADLSLRRPVRDAA